MSAEIARKDVVRYSVNAEFTRAALFFRDDSFLEFEHSSRENRWARPSTGGTLADSLCQSIRQFRLNAKHLQLFFIDGSSIEFTESPAQSPERAS